VVERQSGGVREQLPLVPRDDGTQRLDDRDGSDPLVLEGGDGGVAETEAADDDVEMLSADRREPEPGQLDLGNGEEARHEELLAELHLVDVDEEGRLEPAPQADLPQRGLLPVDLLETPAHGVSRRSA
jgi:hypothetical protein